MFPPGSSSYDIYAPSGNLRTLQGGDIGDINPQSNALENTPDIIVNGAIGLIQTNAGSTILGAYTSIPATGDIQIISAGGPLAGIFESDKAIGIIRAGSVPNGTTFSEPAPTEFHIDEDHVGNDGVIDLIDIAGDYDGASIIEGPSGEVRFMRVGGVLRQDAIFVDVAGQSQTGTRGEIVYPIGVSVPIVDDSGATINLIPTTLGGNGTNGSTQGTLTVRKFGVRGHGGDVIVDVTSTTGLTVQAVPGGSGRPAEIGTINVGAGAIGVSVVNAIPTLNASGGGSMLDVTLESTGAGRMDVYDIRGTTIDHIINTTDGDIFNINAGDVGTISSHGSIGSMSDSTGAILNGLTVFSNTFPFANQRFGVNVGNVGAIIADKSIGNVIASGVIGLISANNDNVHDPNDPNHLNLEGLTGPILINGTAPANQSSNVQQAIPQISVTQVKIGEGIATEGSAATPNTGIYAAGDINLVTGSNADIRGSIVTQRFIGTVSLTNGSIINSFVASFSALNMATPLVTVPFQTPDFTVDIDHPIYNISSINIQGTPGAGGGIIGAVIVGGSINSILVGPNGFGLFESDIIGVSHGTINSREVGGYGIRGVSINDARVNLISATGSGAKAPLSNYSPAIRTSLLSQFNPSTGKTQSIVDDVADWILGDGITQRVVEPEEPSVDRESFTTGVQELVFASGEDRLGNVLAYDVVDSSYTFPDATGVISIRNNVDDVEFITGKVTSITILDNASNFDMVAAGAIGPVLIDGDFTPGTMNFITGVSQIIAKGASGNIASFTDKGNFDAFVSAEGTLGVTSVGTQGVKGVPGTGDFSGTLVVGGNHLTTTVFTSLKVWGSVIGGIIDISGNTGTIDVAKSVSGLSQPLTVRGNLASLIVGSDTTVNGSVLGSDVSISGNLAAGLITGALTSNVIILGNANKFTINSESSTANSNILSGALTVGGTLTNAVIGSSASGSKTVITGRVSGSIIGGFIGTIVLGELSGRVWGGEGITSATISNGVDAGASITSSLGNIAKLSITNGDINGAITAPNGALTSLVITGSEGATGVISARSMGALSIPGTVGGTISATQSFTSLTAGTVTSGAFIFSPNLGTVTTKGDLNGVLNIGATATAVKFTVGGNLGANVTVGSPFSATVAGNMTVGSQIADSNILTALAVKGSINGDIFASRTITTLTAAAISGAVITAGQGLTTLTVPGLVSNTLLQVGLARGIDNIFGTGDVGEQARMADLGTAAVGTMSNSIFAVGGNVNSFKAAGTMFNSSVSSGLVLRGTNIQAVLNDATPFATIGEMNAARQNPTLLHGNIKSATVGSGTASSLINSTISAGVSPGADGSFGTPDDNVNTSITGGVSSITSFKGILDGTSHILANNVGGSATLIGYSVGTASNSILAADPITGSPTQTASVGSVATISTAAGIITITVTGAGATVQAYDDPATTDRLDTILISDTASTAVSVVVHTSSANSFGLGRVITTDGTNLANFTFDGDILGDAAGGPALWIDSDMTSFTVRNIPADSTWSGQIGGNISKLTINQLGPGQLRVGGRINTLSINSSVGNPLLQQLGTVAPPASITQLFYDPSSGNTFASDGTNLMQVDVNNGSVSSNVDLHSLLDGSQLDLSGLTFDNLGNLLGVTTLNNQNPLNLVGNISTTVSTSIGDVTTFGDDLHGMAINSAGVIYAVDSSSGEDKLVTIDPTSGARDRDWPHHRCPQRHLVGQYFGARL